MSSESPTSLEPTATHEPAEIPWKSGHTNKIYFFACISKKRLLANTNSEELVRKIEEMGETEFSSPCG